MSADEQNKIVADYIMANVPGEPSRDEGAGTCAVRLLKKYRAALGRETQDELTASEALYGFCGWLSTRPEPTVMSGHHDAPPIVELIGTFMKANGLSEPRDEWHHNLVRVEEDEPPSEDPRRSRWCLYNFAFRVFGKTRLWPRLGSRIWN